MEAAAASGRTPASRRLLQAAAVAAVPPTALPIVPEVQIQAPSSPPPPNGGLPPIQPSQQAVERQFANIPSLPGFQPSRKREEARALQNLRKRLQAVRILEARPEVPEPEGGEAAPSEPPDSRRPFLFKKILLSRPVSMVLDAADLTTAWQDSDFITDCLCWHNVYRQRHGSPPLTMSSELCYLAQTWANHLAHTNRFYYRNDKDIGQNLFCRPSNGFATEVTGQEVAMYWYSAVRQYDFRKESDILHTNVNAGNFTQLIWANSRHCGVGKARSRSGKVVVVAHYAPAGNTSGSYTNNVLPPCVAELPARSHSSGRSTTGST